MSEKRGLQYLDQAISRITVPNISHCEGLALGDGLRDLC